jgi:hypothetical protein
MTDNNPSNQEVPRWVTTWPYNLQPTFGSSTIDWTKVEVVPAAEYDHLMRELQEWKDSHTTNDLCLSRRIEECQRLHAALAEKEKTLDEWYRFEARLHAAMHHFGGGDIIRKAIAATGADLKAHNPLLGEAAPPAETKP